MKIKIYQINTDRDRDMVAFMPLASMVEYKREIQPEIYDEIFEGDVRTESLEGVFVIFNNGRVHDYHGRSLSVSDVVEVIESDTVEPGFYFCDRYSFEKVEFDAQLTVKPSNLIKVIMCRPGEESAVIEIENTLEDYMKAVCGEIEYYWLSHSDNILLCCNRRGRLDGMSVSRFLNFGDNVINPVYGPFFICDGSELMVGSLSDEMIDRYLDWFRYPVTITDDGIVDDPNRRHEEMMRAENHRYFTERFNTIRAVLCRPGEEARVIEIDKSIESYDKVVEGTAQFIYPYKDKVCIICNDVGGLNGMKPCRPIHDDAGNLVDVVFGPFLVVGLAGYSIGSLSDELIEKYLEIFRQPISEEGGENA